jgi:uracil DNA glycosylase
MKVLVVGMNPSSKPTLNGKANATFKKLESWMDRLGVHYFSFVNTFDDPSQAQHSKVDYNRLVQLAQSYDKIIALGNFVSNSLNRVNVTHFKMPHPSPLNRLLNDKTYERNMIKKCKEYLQ